MGSKCMGGCKGRWWLECVRNMWVEGLKRVVVVMAGTGVEWLAMVFTLFIPRQKFLSVLDKDSNPMHIVHVTAEMAPIAKVGGLGDVINELKLICTLIHTMVALGFQTNVYRAVASVVPALNTCSKEQFGKSGLDGDVYATTDKAVDERTIGHNPERLSLLKGGIVYSNAVVYKGVLNGIDTALWNPTTDPLFQLNLMHKNLKERPYAKSMSKEALVCPQHLWRMGGQMILLGKASNDHVEREFEGLATLCPPSRPLARAELIAFSPEEIFDFDSALSLKLHIPIEHQRLISGTYATRALHVRLSPMSDPCHSDIESEGGALHIYYHGLLPSLLDRKEQWPVIVHNQGPSIRILLIYSEELSHMLYAAADMVLVPSIYEPCGLAQMIGMRYGAVPIVRKTGGLADTVFDMDDQSNQEISNGVVQCDFVSSFEIEDSFKCMGINAMPINLSVFSRQRFIFEGIDEGSLSSAMDQLDEWQMLVKKIMQIDNSWNNAAAKYISIYNSVRTHC
ncbi:putative starch synthase 4 chloroplastic/amyloplastic [Bienertia sinuspersici]